MHLRYGSWCHHHGEHQCIDIDMYRQTQMVRWSSWSKAEKPWTWREQICSTFVVLLLHEQNVTLYSNIPGASEAFFGEWLQGRRTNARSIIGVTLARQFCGHWRQTCKNCRSSLVFFQSGRRLLKSLIDSQHLKQSRRKEKIFQPSRLSHLRSSSS